MLFCPTSTKYLVGARGGVLGGFGKIQCTKPYTIFPVLPKRRKVAKLCRFKSVFWYNQTT